MDREKLDALKKMFQLLPEDVQGLISQSSLRENIELIVKSFSLSLTQAAALENETLFVLLGMLPPSEFVRSLSQELELPQDAAQEIGRTINIQVFRQVRDSLKKIHNIEERDIHEIPEEERRFIEVIPTQGTPEISDALPQALRKEEILRGIENPRELTKPPQQTEDKQEPREVGRDDASQSQAPITQQLKPTEVPAPEERKEERGTLFEERLRRIVSMPKEELKIDEVGESEERSQNPRSYKIDPYREPPLP